MGSERTSESSLRQTRNHRLLDRSPHNSVESHHAVMSHHAVRQSSPLRVATARRTLSSDHFRLNFPTRLKQRDMEHVLKVLESSRTSLIGRLSTNGISLQLRSLELFFNETTGDFVGRTGQSPWVAAATSRNRIELQPFDLLTRRRILETTLRHELVHAVVDEIGHGRTPRWLAEGLAVHFAGEGQLVSRNQRNADVSTSQLDLVLSQPSSVEQMRAAYAAAYREVKRLIKVEGESSVWRRATQPS